MPERLEYSQITFQNTTKRVVYAEPCFAKNKISKKLNHYMYFFERFKTERSFDLHHTIGLEYYAYTKIF